MPHAAGPHRTKHGGGGIALYRVKHVAREAPHEVSRRRGQKVRADAVHWVLGAEVGDQLVHRTEWRLERASVSGTAAQGGDGGADTEVGHRGNPHDSKRR